DTLIATDTATAATSARRDCRTFIIDAPRSRFADSGGFGGRLYEADGGVRGEPLEREQRHARDDRAAGRGDGDHAAAEAADPLLERRGDLRAHVDERAVARVDLHRRLPGRDALELCLAAPPIDLVEELRVELPLRGRACV